MGRTEPPSCEAIAASLRRSQLGRHVAEQFDTGLYGREKQTKKELVQ